MKCRVCGSQKTIPFLNLGEQPLANRLLSQEDLSKQESRYSLGLEYCPDCTFVQTTYVVPPQEMFLEYPYATGTSASTREHFRDMASAVSGIVGLKPSSIVVDVGSNDGTLLEAFRDLGTGVDVVGIEPAENLAKAARARRLPTISGFFDRSTVAQVRELCGRADVVTACNVFTHVPDPGQFLEDAKALMKDDGTLVLEFYYLWDLIANGAFDQVYHEHMSYFSLRTLRTLIERADLEIWNVQHPDVQGGSLRVYASRTGLRPVDEFVDRVVRSEYDPFRSIEHYRDFGDRAEERRAEILRFLRDAKAAGRTVAGYAAAAKATVLLNYCGVGPRDIAYVVDDTPLKQGKWIPGVKIPIVPKTYLDERRPDDILIFAWNLAREISDKLTDHVARGTRIFVPLPELREVT